MSVCFRLPGAPKGRMKGEKSQKKTKESHFLMVKYFGSFVPFFKKTEQSLKNLSVYK